jgi:hypothetical protein
MGSGTTAKMAMQNGRYFLGFDISPEYVLDWQVKNVCVLGQSPAISHRIINHDTSHNSPKME